MKKIKLISMLIFLAMLSFSCTEDDEDGKEDDNPKLSSNASDYMFLENKKYTYRGREIEDGDTNSTDSGFELNVHSNEEHRGKNAIKTTRYEDDDLITEYYYSDNSKIYQSSKFIMEFFFDGYLEDEIRFEKEMGDWFVLLDLEKESWSTEEIRYKTDGFDDFFEGKPYYAFAKIEFTNKGEIEYKLNDKVYRGYDINCLYIEEFGLVGTLFPTYLPRSENFYFVEGLGIVKHYHYSFGVTYEKYLFTIEP